MAAQTYPGKGLSLSQLAFALSEELKRTAYSSSFTFDNVSQLDKDISTVLANIREWRNSFIPINRIPLDVLSLIPTHLAFQKEQFRSTFVCRHWRKTFLQHGPLWSQLYLHKGEAYMKTLLKRAKGSALDIATSLNDPAGVITLLPPYTQQIRSIVFAFNYWRDIQRFSEANPGPLPLLSSLIINVVDEFSLEHPNRMTPPSLPLFTNAVTVKEFILHSERFPFLGHFIFPNLTTFELSATPGLTSEPEYRGLELLDFLEASPKLRTITMKIIAGTIRLHDLPRERVVVLPNVDAFSLVIDDAGAGYELVARISCPSVKRTSLVHERFNNDDVPQVIFPSPPSWNVIGRQYTSSQVNEVALSITSDNDPILSCSLAFRSPDTTVLGLEFKLLKSDDEDDDQMPHRDMHSTTLSQALRSIRDYPLLPHVKSLRIGSISFINHYEELGAISNVFGTLVKSVGPLDVLSLFGCDLRVYLAPFIHLPEFDNMEQSIVYPSIKELNISHPLWTRNKEECVAAIVEFAKSQHARGIPFERLVFCTWKLPIGLAESLVPWVGEVDCYEELGPEDI